MLSESNVALEIVPLGDDYFERREYSNFFDEAYRAFDESRVGLCVYDPWALRDVCLSYQYDSIIDTDTYGRLINSSS